MRSEFVRPLTRWQRCAVAKDGPAALSPDEQVAVIVGRVDRAHQAQHRDASARQSHGNGMSAVAALHRGRAVVWIDDPDAVHACGGGARARFFAEVAPIGKGAQKYAAYGPLGLIVSRAAADLATRPIWAGALVEQDRPSGGDSVERNLQCRPELCHTNAPNAGLAACPAVERQPRTGVLGDPFQFVERELLERDALAHVVPGVFVFDITGCVHPIEAAARRILLDALAHLADFGGQPLAIGDRKS